ncbi:MAG: oligosaccharide flippase family protein [Gemmatimonadota bacterium]|nr:oligosaccharide flippase family protein [Gemmatimonadota bacterium]
MLDSLRRRLAHLFGAENREFLAHGRNYLSGTLVANVLVALSIPLLTQLLTPAEYGVLSVFTSSVVPILTVLLSLNLNSGITRYYLEDPPDFDACLGSNLLFLLGFTGIMGVALFLLREPLAAFTKLDPDVFLAAVGVAMLAGLIEIHLALLNASRQSRWYSVLTVLRTGGTVALFLLLAVMLTERKYLGRVYADLIVSGVFAAYAAWSLGRMARFRIEWKHIRYVLIFSLPLIPHSISRFVLGYFDRIILLQLTTKEATGLYSFAYDVGTAMNLVVLASAKAWRPIFFDDYRVGNFDKINRMSRHYADYVYLAAVAIMLFAGDVALLLVDARYYGALPLVPVIVLSYVFVFLYTLFFQYAAFRNRTGLISLNTFIAGFANIGLNYYFIPLYGYQVAAYTTLASFVLLFLLHYFNARVVLREQVLALGHLLPNLLLTCGITVATVLLARSTLPYAAGLLLRFVLLGLAAWFLLLRKRAHHAAPPV